jgi:predicted GIY-YIG superfamily endonuclease
MPYHVYVILCEDGSLYIGYATKVDLGMKLHMRGMPTKLVYVEEFASRAEAMKREKTRNVRPSPEEELIKCQINPK